MMKILVPALAVLGLMACAQTEQQSGSSMAPNSGFLHDYSNLKPGKEGQFALRYVNPNVDWSKYRAIYLEPVQFWAQPESTVKPDEQQKLCNYYYNTLKQHLSTQLPIVAQPGPNIIIMRAALTEASGATPGLRTISVVVPQARLLSGVTNMATGSYAFVGSAQSEAEALDGQTREQLAAGIDRRSGGLSVKNAGVWEWGDAENIMNYWAELVTERLGQIRAGQAISMR